MDDKLEEACMRALIEMVKNEDLPMEASKF